MAAKAVPHFTNAAGLREIRVAVKEFMCIGANPPFDHPHVFLDMGSDDEKICPYCSTLYKYDASLGHALCAPAEALYEEKAA